MDISVRRLNHRLALQLPKELPLGLVFVMGVVGEVKDPVEEEEEGLPNGRIQQIEFELLEDDYVLRCVLTHSVENPTTVWEGEKVRVGGHLTFDPRYADYFLMTHDVEIIFEEEEMDPLFSEDSLALVHEQEALAAALAGVKRRSQAVSQLEPANLPIWVQKIAPLEVQEKLGVDGAKDQDSNGDGHDSTGKLTTEMVSDLSEAMEKDGDTVITTDLLANYVGEEAESLGSTSIPSQQKNGNDDAPANTAQNDASEQLAQAPYTEDIHETDWLVIVLIITFFIMIVVLIIATGTLLLR